MPDAVGRDRLPDAQREARGGLEPLPETERAQRAVLVVDRGHAAARGESDAESHRLEVLVVAERQVAVSEAPGGLFAQNAGRLAGLVPLNHAAGHVEVAVRAAECGRVQPERVVVPCDQCRRRVAGDRIEIVPGRLARGQPVAAAPAESAEPAPGGRTRRPAQPLERLIERGAPVELHLSLRDRPGGEVDVRVRQSGHDRVPTQVDDVRRGERRLVHADASRHHVPGDRERTRGRDLRVERPHEPVFETHRPRIY